MRALVVDKAAIKHNINEIKKASNGVRIIADLSGDGQGIGVLKLASVLREEGIRAYAVSSADDAVALRQNGYSEEQIFMLRPTVVNAELEALVEHGITCTVGSYDTGLVLSSIAESHSTVAEVKAAIDTGLGRYGFSPLETDKVINLYKHMSGIEVVGMYTSLSSSWKNKKLTKKQLDMFISVINRLQEAGYETGPVHALDSAALFKYDFDRLDEVCVGSAIIGRLPGRSNYGLKRVGCIEAPIEEIDWMARGSKIGLGATYKLKSNSRIGTVGIGWSNGIGLLYDSPANAVSPVLRRFMNLFSEERLRAPLVRVNDTRVKLAGRPGHTSLGLNLTNVECSVGDIAVIEADPRLVKGLPVVLR